MLLNFTLPISPKFMKFFLPTGGGRLSPTRSPLSACPYNIIYFHIIKNLWPARKLKDFLKNLHIFSNFLNIFQFYLLILMHIFEKLPQILVKFRSTLENSDPQTFCGPLSTEKSCINYWITLGKHPAATIKIINFNLK